MGRSGTRLGVTMIKRVAAHLVAFFFVYSVQFIGSPGGLGTRVWLGIIGSLLLAYQALIHLRRKKLDPHFQRTGLLLLSLALLSLATVTFNSTSDLAFIIYAPSMLVVASAAFTVSQVVRRAYPANPGIAAKNIFATIVMVQLSIALLMFASPDIGRMLNGLQITNDLDANLLLETGQFRLSGFGSRFFAAGIANCYALILIASLIRSARLSRMRVLYLAAAFMFIASFGMMMSRTTVIGATLATAFLVLPISKKNPSHHRFRHQRGIFWLSIVVVPMALVVPVLVFAPKFVAEIEPALQFGFELFVNYSERGQLESKSTSQLLDMYANDFNLPMVIGDGHYVDPQDPEEYYKSVDIGYIRLIYYFGIPGLIIYFLFQYQSIQMSAAHLGRTESRKFLAVCMMLVLILSFKGFTDIFVFSIYVYSCALGREAFFRIARSPARSRLPFPIDRAGLIGANPQNTGPIT